MSVQSADRGGHALGPKAASAHATVDLDVDHGGLVPKRRERLDISVASGGHLDPGSRGLGERSRRERVVDHDRPAIAKRPEPQRLVKGGDRQVSGSGRAGSQADSLDTVAVAVGLDYRREQARLAGRCPERERIRHQCTQVDLDPCSPGRSRQAG